MTLLNTFGLWLHTLPLHTCSRSLNYSASIHHSPPPPAHFWWLAWPILIQIAPQHDKGHLVWRLTSLSESTFSGTCWMWSWSLPLHPGMSPPPLCETPVHVYADIIIAGANASVKSTWSHNNNTFAIIACRNGAKEWEMIDHASKITWAKDVTWHCFCTVVGHYWFQ